MLPSASSNFDFVFEDVCRTVYLTGELIVPQTVSGFCLQ